MEDAGPGGEPEEEEDRGGRGAQSGEGRGPGEAWLLWARVLRRGRSPVPRPKQDVPRGRLTLV